MPPRTRDCHSGLVKLQQRIHKEIRCFLTVRKRNVTYKKCSCFFTTKWKSLLRCTNNYWPAVAFTFCATFKRAINRPKNYPQIFFFSNLFINEQAFIISGRKKLRIISLLCKRVLGKRRKNHYQSAVLLYWYVKTIIKLL